MTSLQGRQRRNTDMLSNYIFSANFMQKFLEEVKLRRTPIENILKNKHEKIFTMKFSEKNTEELAEQNETNGGLR